MHAWIPFGLVSRFHDQIKEGRVYDISKFCVIPYDGKYKCVEGDMHILISHLTQVREVPDIFEDVLHFVNLAMIDQVHFQDDHCIGIYCTLMKTDLFCIIFTVIYMMVLLYFRRCCRTNCGAK